MLLPKKVDVEKKLTFERKIAIDEGVKIAKRVNKVREELSEGEAELARFRQESMKAILEELDPLIREANLLKKKLLALQNKYGGK
jgi:predicted transcriptional regulator